MSTAVLPALKGLTYPLQRTPKFNTSKQEAISGKRTTIARWAYPRYQWSLTWSLLRTGEIQGVGYTEFDQIEGFFEQLKGGFDSFLYEDLNDNAVSNQPIGVGNGVANAFPLVRTLGTASAPVLAPNLSKPVSISVNGTVIDPSGYTITTWGTANADGPGLLIFTSAPASGAVITASYSYYFPCQFDDDKMDFSLFAQSMYELQKVTFSSLK